MLQILFNYFFDKPITLSYIYIWISFLKLYIKLVLILLKNTNIVHIYLFNYFIYERYILIFIANFVIYFHLYFSKFNIKFIFTKILLYSIFEMLKSFKISSILMYLAFGLIILFIGIGIGVGEEVRVEVRAEVGLFSNCSNIC